MYCTVQLEHDNGTWTDDGANYTVYRISYSVFRILTLAGKLWGKSVKPVYVVYNEGSHSHSYTHTLTCHVLLHTQYPNYIHSHTSIQYFV